MRQPVPGAALAAGSLFPCCSRHRLCFLPCSLGSCLQGLFLFPCCINGFLGLGGQGSNGCLWLGRASPVCGTDGGVAGAGGLVGTVGCTPAPPWDSVWIIIGPLTRILRIVAMMPAINSAYPLVRRQVLGIQRVARAVISQDGGHDDAMRIGQKQRSSPPVIAPANGWFSNFGKKSRVMADNCVKLSDVPTTIFACISGYWLIWKILYEDPGGQERGCHSEAD